jgi:hypothetical protein
MSAEYTWEMFIADHDRDVAFHDRYIFIPTFVAKVLVEEVLFPEDKRDEFNVWLSWYGSMMHYYREEIRGLLRKKPSYKLSGINIPEKTLEKLYRQN